MPERYSIKGFTPTTGSISSTVGLQAVVGNESARHSCRSVERFLC
jgi:hypothetical protein